MRNINVYANFTKFDEEQRIVEGIASTPSLDSQGEIVEINAITKAIPDYMALRGGGNLREMHQPSAVGKVPEMWIEDGKVMIRAKVVDDAAWKKVKENVYTGFSIGGKVLKRIGNTIKDLKLSEISLVDRPANPEALFTFYKFDMDTQETKQEEVVAEEVTLPVVEEVEATEAAEAEAAKEVAEEVAAEEAKEEVTEAVEEIQEKSDSVEDLAKAELENTLSKVQGELDLAKAEVNSLRLQVEDLTKRLEDTVVASPVKASFTTLDRFDKSDKFAVERARYNELLNKANTLTVAERNEALQLNSILASI